MRNLWKILDLLAVVISLPAVLYSLPFSLLMVFGIIASLLAQAKITGGLNCFLADIFFALAGIEAVFGVASLGIAALISAKKICRRKLFKSLIIIGLISGIIAAVYYMHDLAPFGQSTIYLMSVNFVWTGSYMVLSAIMHIFQLLYTKAEDKKSV